MLADALSKIKHIAECLDDDDPDKLEMINIEGDYSKLMDWAILKRIDALSYAQSCADVAAAYKDREARYKSKADKFKGIAATLMECANERKYEGAYGTVSLRKTPRYVVITDESSIPNKYKKTQVVVDKKALKDALNSGVVQGAELSNGGETISIRVK